MERIMKKIVSAAAVCVVAIPTMAASIEMPTVYGKINKAAIYTDQDSTGRTSFAGFADVDSSETRLGVKGKWDLENVEGTYVIEMGLNSSKDSNGTDFRIRMRQAAVGAKTAFGTIKAGQTYTPMDYTILKTDLLSSTVASMAGSDTSARIDGAVSRLGMRYRARTDMVSYETPSIGGLTLSLSTDRDNGMNNDSTDADYGPTHYTGLVKFDRQMGKVDMNLFAGYDTWAEDGEDNTYTLAGAKFGFGNFQLNAAYSIEENDAATKTEINRTYAGAQYTMNKNVFAVTYQLRDEKDAGNEYTQIAAHYRYMFTKKFDMSLTVLTYDVDETAGTQNEATMAAAGIQLKF
ncbi:general bacterial porin family protein [Halobacteriovorax sp. BALOs_7]|nr:general bacterial porin family protein [Halobacteriovorax sp. BALOs_7]